MRTQFLPAMVLVALVSAPAGAAPMFTGSPDVCAIDLTKCVLDNGDIRVELFPPFYIDPLLDPTGAYKNIFVPAFDAWKATQGGRWFLLVSPLTDTAVLNLDIYRAFAGENPGCDADACGGAELQISYTKGGARDPLPITDTTMIETRNGVWTQSIWTSEKGNSAAPGNPYLDGGQAGAHLALPAFPFQYDGSEFYDKPSRDADNIWKGQAFLTQINYGARLVTVYGGVGWGFTVRDLPDGVVPELPVILVPEPASGLLCGVALVAVFARRRLRAAFTSL